ncbi:MAG: sigma-54-dependent Fis family transcriptional regulator [Bacteroidales bacterium]|nr:sigma-54-dependent Fis family transcriptional regulator [Bacteroidales bacterium]
MDSQELQRLKNKFDIIGNDASLNRALEMAVAVASTDLTVLVTGESGVGKDVIPKIIHQNSSRKTKKYLAVNCAAIPEGTVDSELFGHEKGSFTGAYEARKGYFEEANGGTLFLDEIGELPMATQAKLLRVLQSGEYIRVGSSRVDKTDVRLIAATNVDLQTAVAQGKFRQDLYYRLSSVCITVPPLRERKEDVYLLFRKFTTDFSEKYSRKKVNLTRDAIELLLSYRWPGNIRELQSLANTVSLFETTAVTPNAERCEINAQTLSKYLKTDEAPMLPAIFHDGKQAISEDEKNGIYSAIFSLKKEVEDLKSIIAAGGYTKPQEAQSHYIDRPVIPAGEDGGANIISKPESYNRTDDDVDNQYDGEMSYPEGSRMASNIDDQSHLHHDAEKSLTIKGSNEEMIRSALARHGGNRKKAAEELGISERTLYRKLPEEFRRTR